MKRLFVCIWLACIVLDVTGAAFAARGATDGDRINWNIFLFLLNAVGVWFCVHNIRGLLSRDS